MKPIRLLLLACVAGGCLWMLPAPTQAEGDLGYWDDYWHWYDNSFHPHFHRWYRLNGKVGYYGTEWTAPYYGNPPPFYDSRQTSDDYYRGSNGYSNYSSGNSNGSISGGRHAYPYGGKAGYSGMNEYWFPGDEVPMDRAAAANQPHPFYAGSPYYYGPNSYYYPGDTVPHARLNLGSRPTIVDNAGD
jgi:hypothetical protein